MVSAKTSAKDIVLYMSLVTDKCHMWLQLVLPFHNSPQLPVRQCWSGWEYRSCLITTFVKPAIDPNNIIHIISQYNIWITRCLFYSFTLPSLSPAIKKDLFHYKILTYVASDVWLSLEMKLRSVVLPRIFSHAVSLLLMELDHRCLSARYCHCHGA